MGYEDAYSEHRNTTIWYWDSTFAEIVKNEKNVFEMDATSAQFQPGVVSISDCSN